VRHRVLAEELNPKIPKVNRICIFSRGWVMGITPCSQLIPIQAKLDLITLKKVH